MDHQPDRANSRPTPVDRIGDLLTRGCLAIAAASLLAIVAINGANVIARYVFISPFSWAEEAMLFLMILSVFAGAVAITWRNMHIRIDTFVDLASPAARKVMMAIGALISIAVILTVGYASANIVSILYKLDQRSDALDLPSWIPQSFLTAGLTVIALMIAVRTAQALMRPASQPRTSQEGEPR